MALISWINLITCSLLVLSNSKSQSTSSQPPGYYAGYLNRYTKTDQCVYSFVVPKKDRDQCPGLKSSVQSMELRMRDLEKRQEEMTALISVLKDNEQSWHKIGELKEKLLQLEQQRSELVLGSDRLKAERDHEITKRQQVTIDLEDTKNQFEALQGKYAPLQRNYSQLLDKFNKAEEVLKQLQFKYENMENSMKILKMAKNCTSISKHLPSCASIKRMGYSESGYSMIDPDGEGGMDPFVVYCDMESDTSTGITVVEHDHAPNSQVIGCEDPGCLKQVINYKGTSLDQISKLIEISIACEQFIRYDCYDSKLLKDGTGWWTSRQGRRMNYWGGASKNTNMCACGEKGECDDKNEVCNCDADSEEWLYDAGFLRDKAVLPVTELNFGDVSEDKGERGKSTLGDLRCKWDVGYPVPSCEALQKAGVTESGDYLVKTIQENGEDVVKRPCNLNIPAAYAMTDSSTLSADRATNNNSTGPIDPLLPGTVLRPHGNKNLYVFTDCGQSFGRFGPTQEMCNQTYRNTNVKVSLKEGIQQWVVPATGRYKIEAKAPSGQQHLQRYAGRGATVNGEFDLAKGTIIKILVGQKGSRHTDRPYYGGSGGTFVVKFVDWVNQPLVVAGGGGCSATRTAVANLPITDASGSRDGKDASDTGTNYGRGGKDGHGGERGGKALGRNTPGGGSGFMHDGTESGDKRWGGVEPAKAFTSHGTDTEAPGVGGRFRDGEGKEFNGGFGGGGSAALHASGGAGGYSGGGGGPDEGYSGGGGSFANAQNGRSIDIGVNNIGPGLVKIEYLGPSVEFERGE